MPLPELIEIVPLDKPVRAHIAVPGSKSITNRALILGALSGSPTALEGALWSEDTQVMVEGLSTLGFEIDVQPDPVESCNRKIKVDGLGGRIPKAGTVARPLEIYVGNAGTAARFLAALLCLGQGSYRLHGAPRMHERPQTALFAALRELGYRIDSPNDKLPASVSGAGPRAGKCRVSIEESSQFASALILCSRAGRWEVTVLGESPEEAPYVAMTWKLAQAFPQNGGNFQIEPDASSASYFWAAGDNVSIKNWPSSGWQVDAAFPEYLSRRQADGTVPTISRRQDLGDSIMTAIVLAPLGSTRAQFKDLGRLRVQECERVVALRTELTKCGASIKESGDTLEVLPSKIHGAEIETYDDHRMAMCFAVLGLKVAGIRIKNPACVKKTFPNFFQKLAASPPDGLGATVLDAKSGRKLGVGELFSD